MRMTFTGGWSRIAHRFCVVTPELEDGKINQEFPIARAATGGHS
jgi:hypothetical protein